ncbi:MAG: hypothetical protein OQL28_05160 [Sedimenticola sp.]|nr:hypothetical protein [Sedimenticola sp.]
MKLKNIISTSLVASALLLALSGCEKGPAEKVGASIDNAAEKAGDQIEKAGDAIKNAAEGDSQ